MIDQVYYQRRLSEELLAAARADCPQAAAAHRELAEIYRILVFGEIGPSVVILNPDEHMAAGNA